MERKNEKNEKEERKEKPQSPKGTISFNFALTSAIKIRDVAIKGRCILIGSNGNVTINERNDNKTPLF